MLFIHAVLWIKIVHRVFVSNLKKICQMIRKTQFLKKIDSRPLTFMMELSLAFRGRSDPYFTLNP